ncbi:MAG: prolyl oligopeptidase family serine peptidase [Acidobacteriota bacterium]|nr:prolyl oligopeptidase family serine peptidase [Acidobacteriota bacterium]
MKRITFWILALFFTAFVPNALAQKTETGFLKRTVTVGKITRNFKVYIPENFNPKKKYPVVLFLHGAGSRGDDNEKHIPGEKYGLGGAIQGNPEKYVSFIAVFPQLVENGFWIGNMIDYAVAALDLTVTEFKADEKRLYVTGFSLGGYGSFYAAAKYPNKFAAIVPVGGGILPPNADKIPPLLKAVVHPEIAKLYDAENPRTAFAQTLKNVPTWIFHGEKDEAVPVSEARQTAEAFKKAGAALKYTEYEGADHFIPARVYADGALWKWLLAQKLGVTNN